MNRKIIHSVGYLSNI